MEMICKRCGAIYSGEILPVDLECTCHCHEFECSGENSDLSIEEN